MNVSTATDLSPTLCVDLFPLPRSTSSEARFIEFVFGTVGVPTTEFVIVVWNSSPEGRCHPSCLHRCVTISSALPRRMICFKRTDENKVLSLIVQERAKSPKCTYIRIDMSHGSLVNQNLFNLKISLCSDCL